MDSVLTSRPGLVLHTCIFVAYRIRLLYEFGSYSVDCDYFFVKYVCVGPAYKKVAVLVKTPE